MLGLAFAATAQPLLPGAVGHTKVPALGSVGPFRAGRSAMDGARHESVSCGIAPTRPNRYGSLSTAADRSARSRGG